MDVVSFAHAPGRWSAVALVVAAGLAALLAPGRVDVHQCVDAGRFAPVGVRFALLTDTTWCPPGQLGWGATTHGLVLVATVAVPALLLHLVLATAGLPGWRRARTALALVATLVRRLLVAVLAELPTLPVDAPAGPPAEATPLLRPCRGHAESWSYRGPPVRVA